LHYMIKVLDNSTSLQLHLSIHNFI